MGLLASRRRHIGPNFAVEVEVESQVQDFVLFEMRTQTKCHNNTGQRGCRCKDESLVINLARKDADANAGREPHQARALRTLGRIEFKSHSHLYTSTRGCSPFV